MRFFNPFKSNFARIAENTTKYYLELTEKYQNRFDDEVSLLATAGVLDAQNYIFVRNPQISVLEILDMAKQVVSGSDSIGQQVRVTRELEKYKRATSAEIISGLVGSGTLSAPLVDFVISLEVKLFKVDSPRLAVADIAEACSDKSETIEKAVRRTREKYAGERMFSSSTAAFMESPQLVAVRKKLGIKELRANTQLPNLPKKKKATDKLD